jgi:hypothetical protein
LPLRRSHLSKLSRPTGESRTTVAALFEISVSTAPHSIAHFAGWTFAHFKVRFRVSKRALSLQRPCSWLLECERARAKSDVTWPSTGLRVRAFKPIGAHRSLSQENDNDDDKLGHTAHSRLVPAKKNDDKDNMSWVCPLCSHLSHSETFAPRAERYSTHGT